MEGECRIVQVVLAVLDGMNRFHKLLPSLVYKPSACRQEDVISLKLMARLSALPYLEFQLFSTLLYIQSSCKAGNDYSTA